MEGLDPVQIRVLGCLLEKQQTTPDAYPLTLNSLRLACNQSTNRDPVVDYDEPAVREAAQRLAKRGWARFASYHGSRSVKYRHLLDEALGLAPDERALLCVLMLRGPQTLGELKQRTERMHRFADLPAVEQGLERLTSRELGRWLDRKPGQKEARYTHLLEEEADEESAGGEDAAVPSPVAAMAASTEASAAAAGEASTGASPGAAAPPGPDGLAAEVARLRRDLEALRTEVAAMRQNNPDFPESAP